MLYFHSFIHYFSHKIQNVNNLTYKGILYSLFVMLITIFKTRYLEGKMYYAMVKRFEINE